MARDLGYKIIDIHEAVVFNEVEGTFEKFVEDVYNFKLDAEKDGNDGLRLIYKLILNSLFGRFGLKKQNITYLILTDENALKYKKRNHFDVLYRVNGLNFIKKTSVIDEELVLILNNENLIYSDNMSSDNMNYSSFNKININGTNISSVQYSAAITSYGRMFMNQFKNIKDNIYIGGDTDSVILSKRLDNLYVGTELGKLKLEKIIKEGFYHSKKSYLQILDNDIKVIK